MKVKMKGDVTGTRNGEPWPRPGEVVDLPDHEAATLCEQGMATPVRGDAAEVTRPDQSDVETRTTAEKAPRKRASGLTKKSVSGGDA